MTANPYMSYQRNHVETADRGTLLLLLYDGAVRFMREARSYMEKEEFSKAFVALARVDRIVRELVASLDMEKGGEIAVNLYRLYEFVLWKVFLAEKEKEVSHLDEALHIIDELRMAWKEAIEKEKQKEAQPKKDRVSSKSSEEKPSVSIVG